MACSIRPLPQEGFFIVPQSILKRFVYTYYSFKNVFTAPETTLGKKQQLLSCVLGSKDNFFVCALQPKIVNTHR
jgi:hypothetical protein